MDSDYIELWRYVSFGWVFLALPALFLLEAGACRKGSGQNILIKNWAQLSVGVIMWWLVGYGIAFGDVDEGFIGTELFSGKDWTAADFRIANHFALLGLLCVFIVNLATAERLSWWGSVVFSGVVLGWVFPVVAAWAHEGWLQSFDSEYIDRGGTARVYLFSGSLVLPAVFFLKYRVGVEPGTIPHPNDPILVVTGNFLAWIAVLGGSSETSPGIQEVGTAIWNSLLAGGTCSVVSTVIMGAFKHEMYDLFVAVLEGTIAGMVSVSSLAQTAKSPEVFAMAVINAPAFVLTYKLVKKNKTLDDALNMFATFYVPGLLGTIFVGFFDREEGVLHGAGGGVLGVQALGALVISLWGFLWSSLVFGLLRLVSLSNVNNSVQTYGFDEAVLDKKGFRIPGIESDASRPEEINGN